jgi:hypothetical protein
MSKKSRTKKNGRTTEPSYTVTFTESELCEVMGCLDAHVDTSLGGLNDYIGDNEEGERAFKRISRKLSNVQNRAVAAFRRTEDSKSRTA